MPIRRYNIHSTLEPNWKTVNGLVLELADGTEKCEAIHGCHELAHPRVLPRPLEFHSPSPITVGKCFFASNAWPFQLEEVIKQGESAPNNALHSIAKLARLRTPPPKQSLVHIQPHRRHLLALGIDSSSLYETYWHHSQGYLPTQTASCCGTRRSRLESKRPVSLGEPQRGLGVPHPTARSYTWLNFRYGDSLDDDNSNLFHTPSKSSQPRVYAETSRHGSPEHPVTPLPAMFQFKQKQRILPSATTSPIQLPMGSIF
ncbi:hypothetical protein QBC39DRAFT_115673 [Podospora conica]|nr:hypothetical protein QBC39DRAFT_115673 [Schizothecium conicum]